MKMRRHAVDDSDGVVLWGKGGNHAINPRGHKAQGADPERSGAEQMDTSVMSPSEERLGEKVTFAGNSCD